MGRREQAAEMRSTWMVLEPREAGRPFRRKDLDDADARLVAERAAARNAVAQPEAEFVPAVSVRTYLPALARVAVEERHKSPMRE